MLARNGMTPCHYFTLGCSEPGYVILYATGRRFGELDTYPGQQLGFCHFHGGILYDTIRAWRDRHSCPVPTWLVNDLKADRLPRITPRAEGWTRTATIRERRWNPDAEDAIPARPRRRERWGRAA